MSRGCSAEVIIEIVRHSNIKWEYDRAKDELFLDRILEYPYFYPYAYGFFPETLGNDGDELDILLITDVPYLNYAADKKKISGRIVGGIMMYDEKGADEKIFVVPENEWNTYLNRPESEKQMITDDIVWFFSNYKSKTQGKWSRVEYVLSDVEAMEVYNSAKKSFLGKQL